MSDVGSIRGARKKPSNELKVHDKEDVLDLESLISKIDQKFKIGAKDKKNSPEKKKDSGFMSFRSNSISKMLFAKLNKDGAKEKVDLQKEDKKKKR